MTGPGRPAVAVLLTALALPAAPADAAPWKFQRVVTSPKVTRVTEVGTNAAGTLVVTVGLTGMTNAVTGAPDGVPQVVAYDTRTKRSTLVSAGTDGKPGNAYSTRISVSHDGRYVLFVSAASNLVRNDTNGAMDVFVRDLVARRTTRVSVTHHGKQLPGDSSIGAISGDGSTVVFRACGPMAPGAKTLPGECGLYARKRTGGRAIPVSADRQGTMHDAYDPSLSANGRYVAFVTAGHHKLTTDSPNHYYAQAYVFDTAKRSAFRVPGDVVAVPGGGAVEEYADTEINAPGTWLAMRQTTHPTTAGFATTMANQRYVLVNLTSGAATVLGNAAWPFACCPAPPAFSTDGTVLLYGLAELDAETRAVDAIYRRTVKTGATEKVSAAPASPCTSDAGCASPSYDAVAADRTGRRLVVTTSVRHAGDDTDGWHDPYLVTR